MKSAAGSIVNVVGPPVTPVSPTLRVPLDAQTIWNQFPVTFTGSLKVIVRLVFVVMLPAPLAGTVVATAGAASIENVKTWLAGIVSGGSLASWSVTCAANTVAVQLSPAAKSVSGSIV